MKKYSIKKIVSAQIVFLIGGIIAYNILDIESVQWASNHLIITVGHLFGFWDFKYTENQTEYTKDYV